MPTFVFQCEGCGGRKPFLMHEAETAALHQKQFIQRPCPTCHATTNWVPAFSERRSGADRRQPPNRRTTE